MDNTTWYDCKPTHPNKPISVQASRDALDEAWSRYEAAVDARYQPNAYGTFSQEELNELRKTAEILGALHDARYDAWQRDDLVEQRWAIEERERKQIEIGRHAMTEENLP
jgi:hypothetical protein